MDPVHGLGFHPFDAQPALRELLDAYEADLAVEPERACHVSDLELEEQHPTPLPAPERIWCDR